MDSEEAGLTLPSISIVAPLELSEEKVRAEAASRLQSTYGDSIIIVAVDAMETGRLQTPRGVVTGVRYKVSFIKKENVVFIHPDYDKIMSEYTRLREGR